MRRSILVETDAKVVVLDLDDTLYLERDFAHSGFRAVGQRLGNRINAGDFAQYCSDLLQSGTRGNIFDLALRKFDVEPNARLVSDLVFTYREHTPDIGLCDDAQRLLTRLDGRMTGLISDGPERTQSAKVKALGLDAAIDHICLTGSLPEGCGKPHPLAFETIQQLTGLSGTEHVYIADNGAKDFAAPNRLGWQSIQILREERIHDGRPPTQDYAAQAVISSLDDIVFGMQPEDA